MKQKFKGQFLTVTKTVKRILSYYDHATEKEIQEGLNWYTEAYTFAHSLVGKLNHAQICGIISVLSPQCTWNQNKVFASQFVKTGRVKNSRERIDKCKRIAKEIDEDKIYNLIGTKANKTKRFYLNILNPVLSSPVTIDRHAIAACLQASNNTEAIENHMGQLTDFQYEFFSSCYITAASVKGINPNQMQAIVWTVYRRLRGLTKEEIQDTPF